MKEVGSVFVIKNAINGRFLSFYGLSAWSSYHDADMAYGEHCYNYETRKRPHIRDQSLYEIVEIK